MYFNQLCFGLGLCLLVAGGARTTLAVAQAHAEAMAACAALGSGAPLSPVTVVDDGRGGSLVWLTDADANLFLCNADGSGRVYAHHMIFEDLLKGAGAGLAAPISIDRDGKPLPPAPDPLAIATSACQAYLKGETGTVVGHGRDGLEAEWVPGYFVFLETEAGETYLCDATPNAQVWAFARIGAPLSLGSPVG